MLAMIEFFTLLLLILAFIHLWLQGANRHYINITDGPLKPWLNLVWFVTTVPLPTLLVLVFRHWEPLESALRWQPHGLLSSLFFSAITVLLAFMVIRFGFWCYCRFLEEKPENLVSEDFTEVSLPKVATILPRGLKWLETTGNLQLTQREITVAGLAPAFDGVTIAQVADIHFQEGLAMENYFQGVRDFVNSLNADFVVMTGDFVDDRRSIPRAIQYHATFQARVDLLCVMGNHDYWTRPDRILSMLERTPIHYLGDGSRRVYKRSGRRLIFQGTDHPWNPDLPDWEKQIRRGVGDAIVFLSHTPDNAPLAAWNGASLILSGHNHGGQIRLPLIGPLIAPSRYGLRYVEGIHRVGRESLLNVSRGVGVSSARVRMLCPPEICLLTLRAPVVDVMAGQVITMKSLKEKKEADAVPGAIYAPKSTELRS